VGLSERMLQLEFKRRVGHSARKELQRLRLACALPLLRDTDLKIEAIAIESGFSAASRLCEAMVEVYGLTPAIWRQRERGKP
jgi:transcriptional regulator GlxA family with amidase domain